MRGIDRIPLQAAWIGLFTIVCVTPGRAAELNTVRVASGLNRPIYATAPAGDPRLFIVEQRGVIKVLKDGAVLATPFLDIDALVPDIAGNDERGLLGLAFHPDYPTNGYFFVNYINLANDTVIARYSVSANPDVADPASAAVIITIDQPASNHNGGTLLFSPIDGYLYIGMGDGGGAGDTSNNAQNPASLLGKMLRIDVDGAFPYAIPPDNPFVGPDLPLDEIWAIGYRNPYRWSFDAATGDMWVGDVGQGDWEEVDVEQAGLGGRNYGWRRMEGNHCFNPPSNCNDGSLILPVHEYSHGGTPFRCSITGGNVYRGVAIPWLQGTYFFADYCSDQIWSFRLANGVPAEFTDRTAELAPGGGLTILDISGFGEDGFGELYIVARKSTSTGEVYKIVPDPAAADDLTPTGALGLTPAIPNPFRSETRLDLVTDRSAPIDIEVIDAAGRRVRTLPGGDLAPGSHRVAWDGLDDAGLPVATGIYFVRASDGSRTASRPVRLLR